jgi:hypothetical protein
MGMSESLRQLEQERDEAKKQLSSTHRWIERNHADGFIDSLSYSQNLERVADNWYGRLDIVERERDEARQAFVIATDQMVLAQCKLREANTLAEKANELVARWDQPSWKDTAPTAGFINALRDAVKAYEEKP